MLKSIAIGLGAVLLILLGLVAAQPAEFRVERSIAIQAPPAVVFDLVEDFHNWPKWSPWEKLDPNMTKTIEGDGVGATYAWVGNSDVGTGKMTIVESVPNQKVAHRLEFIEPFAGTSTTAFEIAEQGGEVQLRWSMEGKNDFMGKAFSLLMDTDKMIGKDFEQGLAAIKQNAEAQGNKIAGEAP